MTMQELLDLGAPELPEGQYYHVYISKQYGQVHLYVYQQRKWFVDKKVFHESGYPWYIDGELEPVTDIIARYANQYAKDAQQQCDTQEWYKSAQKYKGDHK